MPKDDEIPTDAPAWAIVLLRNQRRTATAIANLTLGLEAAQRAADSRHDQAMGMFLAALTAKTTKKLKAHRDDDGEGAHGEDSAKIYLPGGTEIELPKRTIQKYLVKFLWYAGHGLVIASGWLWHVFHK